MGTFILVGTRDTHDVWNSNQTLYDPRKCHAEQMGLNGSRRKGSQEQENMTVV